MNRTHFLVLFIISLGLCTMSFSPPAAILIPQQVKRFETTASRLELTRPAQPSMPFDVVGRRAVMLGQEDGSFEMWAYPLKIVSDFQWTFLVMGESGIEEVPARQVVSRAYCSTKRDENSRSTTSS